MNGTVAAIVTKAEASRSLHPVAWGALIAAGGVMLILSARPSRPVRPGGA